ncbi:Protein of unknown function [Gryllus bimaculatus]|nr:Protein of unknown function [Gryllus bimaculatus]
MAYQADKNVVLNRARGLINEPTTVIHFIRFVINTENIHKGSDKNRSTMLKMKIERIELMDRGRIDDFLLRARSLSFEITELGLNTEEELVHFINNGVPLIFSNVTTALYAISNVDFELLRDSLIRYEKKCIQHDYRSNVMAYKSQETKKLDCYICVKVGNYAKHCCPKKKFENELEDSESTTKIKC